MHVSLEKLTGLKYQVAVTLPTSDVEELVSRRLRSMAPRVKLQGFRPGKVPLSMLKRMYGDEVRGEVLNQKINEAIQTKLDEQSLQPATRPDLKESPSEGSNLNYQGEFEVLPTIDLAVVDQINVNKPVAEITDEDIDNTLQVLQQQNADWVEVERAAQNGDRLKLSLTSDADHELWQKRDQLTVELGKGNLNHTLENQLIGLEKGEHKLQVTFNNDEPNQALTGKTLNFVITIDQITEPKLPELDDEFAKKLGLDEGLDSLRNEVRTHMANNRDQAADKVVKNRAAEQLLEQLDVELPEGLVSAQLGDQKEPDQTSREKAQQEVKRYLIMMQIVRDQNITVPQQELMATAAGMYGYSPQDPEFTKICQQSPQLLQGMQVSLLENKALDWLVEQVKISEQESSFKEILQLASGQTLAGQAG